MCINLLWNYSPYFKYFNGLTLSAGAPPLCAGNSQSTSSPLKPWVCTKLKMLVTNLARTGAFIAIYNITTRVYLYTIYTYTYFIYTSCWLKYILWNFVTITPHAHKSELKPRSQPQESKGNDTKLPIPLWRLNCFMLFYRIVNVAFV
jgi:hypothetical protein